MKTLIVTQCDNNGYDTSKNCQASTLNNAFKKASMRGWVFYRIYQVYSDRLPHIIFESQRTKEGFKKVAVHDISVKCDDEE